MLSLLENAFLWFFLYSFFGWVYETIYCSITQGKFVNRGFLNGPYCPIYGCGALLVLFALGRFQNPAALFFLGMLLTCSLEYFTSWLMEKLFHARWWDYTDQPFNINGRVCLLGAVVFGLFSLCIVKWLHPFVCSFTERIPQRTLPFLSGGLAVLFFADVAVTCTGFSSFNKKLRLAAEEIRRRNEERNQQIHAKLQAAADRLRETELMQSLSLTHEDLVRKRLNFQQRRMLHAFPKLTSMKYEEALSELREKVRADLEEKRRLRREKRNSGK